MFIYQEIKFDKEEKDFLSFFFFSFFFLFRAELAAYGNSQAGG